MLNTIDSEETVRLAKEIYRGAARCSKSARQYSKRFDHRELTDCGITIYDDRKMHAALNTLPKVKQMFHKTNHLVSKELFIEEDWFCCNAILSESLDMQNERYNLALGAAIWILDELKKAGKLESGSEVISFISETAKAIDIKICIPDFWDLSYGQDLVACVIAIITSRNYDCSLSLKDQELINRYSNINFCRFFGDLATVRRSQHQDVASRKAFDTLLSFIPEEAKKAATDKFEKLVWNITERYVRCRCAYALNEIKLPKTLERLKRQSEELYRASAATSYHPTAVLANPIVIGPNPVYTMTERSKLGVGEERIQRIKTAQRLQEELEKAQNQSDLVMKQISSLWCAMEDLPILSPDKVRDGFDETVYAVWKDFDGINNPYELCFAALYLIDNDNDLVWLHHPCNLLMNFVGTALPWYTNAKTDDTGFDKKSLNDAYTSSYKIQFVSSTGIPCNWAQIVYQLSGSLWPRELSEVEQRSIQNWLNEYGIAEIPSSSSMQQLNCMIRSNDLGHMLMKQGALDAASKERFYEGDQKKCDEISKLNDEISKLKNQLYEADKTIQTLGSKCKDVSGEREREKIELKALRDWMFEQQLTENTEDEEDDAIQFPVRTKTQKIVSYGGHKTWIREIRRMLPDVKFYDGEVTPNEDLIANADMVWIQTNCIGHPSYYKIIDIVKNCKIPFKCFSHASAKLCAKQLLNVLASNK